MAGATFERLARGVLAARAGDAATATPALSEAAAECEGRGWVTPALYARLEIAAQQLAADDPVNAFETLKLALARLPKEPDLPDVQEWVNAVEARMKGAPTEVLDAFREAAHHLLGGSDGMAGGAGGGQGGSGGGVDVSPVGRVFPKWPAGKPFVSVRRTVAGFEVDLPFDDAVAAALPLRSAQRPWDDRGVTLLFAGSAVALRMVDLAGRRGQPGERPHASRAWAFYWLAQGEVFAATKNGIEINGQAAALTPR